MLKVENATGPKTLFLSNSTYFDVIISFQSLTNWDKLQITVQFVRAVCVGKLDTVIMSTTFETLIPK